MLIDVRCLPTSFHKLSAGIRNAAAKRCAAFSQSSPGAISMTRSPSSWAKLNRLRSAQSECRGRRARQGRRDVSVVLLRMLRLFRSRSRKCDRRERQRYEYRGASIAHTLQAYFGGDKLRLLANADYAEVVG